MGSGCSRGLATSRPRTGSKAENSRSLIDATSAWRPLVPDAAWIEQVRAALPILPAARRHRLAAATGSPVDAEPVMLVVERGHDEYVHAVIAAGGDPLRALVHVQQNLGDDDAVNRFACPNRAGLAAGRLA